jgi:O-antigen/teichoic acid export membrane protein
MISKIKQLSRDTAIYGTSIVLGRFLNFLLTPFYTNFLHEKELAFVIYVYSALAFINIAYSFGMETAFFRFYKSDKQLVDENLHHKTVFSNAYMSIIFFSIISTLLIFIFSPQITNSFNNSHYNVSQSLIILIGFIPLLDALVLIPFAYLRMTHQAVKFSTLRFLAIFINVILNIYFIAYLHKGIEGIILAQIISSSIALLIFSTLIIKNFVFKINFKLVKEMLWFGLPTLPASVSAIILQVADRQIMEIIAPKYLAVYGVNYRLGIPMMIFVSVFEYAWKPFYLHHYKDEEAKELFSQVFTYFTVISMLLILFWSLFVDVIVKFPFPGGTLINHKYWIGLDIVPIVLWGYYFNGVFTNFNAGFLIQKKTKYLPIAVGVSAIFNVVLNILIIPQYTYVGAAWATFLAYLLEAVLIYWYSRKIYYIKYDWKKIFTILIITSCIILLNVYIKDYFTSWLLLLAIKFLLMLVFIILLFIFGFLNKHNLQFLKHFVKS